MSSQKHTTDVAIIGAGPAGLFAIFQCGMLKMNCHVIDALEHIGGQCTALYPEKPIFDIPAISRLNANELIDQLQHQADVFAPTYHLNQQVVSLVKQKNGRWLVTTSRQTEIEAKVVIIASGAGAFGPNKPPLERLEHYEGKSIFYSVRRRQDFAGKHIVIAGGGDSAVDWANALSDVAEHIYFVHRRPKFRAAPESVVRLNQLAQEGKIELVIPYQLHSLKGDNGQLEAVQICDLEQNKKWLKADILLPFFGLAANLGPIAQWGLNLDHTHIKTDPTTAETNIPGIYAIGDIAMYPHKLKLILTGFSEAAMAAHHAYPLINDGKELHFEYSTTTGLPATQKGQ